MSKKRLLILIAVVVAGLAGVLGARTAEAMGGCNCTDGCVSGVATDVCNEPDGPRHCTSNWDQKCNIAV